MKAHIIVIHLALILIINLHTAYIYSYPKSPQGKWKMYPRRAMGWKR